MERDCTGVWRQHRNPQIMLGNSRMKLHGMPLSWEQDDAIGEFLANFDKAKQMRITIGPNGFRLLLDDLADDPRAATDAPEA